jgi:hypothetical protein
MARRGASTAGYLVQILLKFGEVLAPTANAALAVHFCGVLVGPLHQAGYNLAGREMGGEEAGCGQRAPPRDPAAFEAARPSH